MRPQVPNISLCHRSSQLFDLRAPLSIEFPRSQAPIFFTSASGRFFIFAAAKASERAGAARLVSHQVTSFWRELFASLSRVSSRAVKVCQNKSICFSEPWLPGKSGLGKVLKRRGKTPTKTFVRVAVTDNVCRKNTQLDWISIKTVLVTFHVAWSGLIAGASVKPFVIG